MNSIAEFEQAVLGCIICNARRVLPLIMPILSADDFYLSDNAAIYAACLRLDSEHKAVDLLTIADATQGIVTATYISGLTEMAPVLAHAETYAQEVKTASKTRQLTGAVLTAQQALKGGAVAQDVIGELLNRIAEIEKDKTNEFVSAREAINGVYDEIREGICEGVLTGYEKVDLITKGLHKSNLIVLAADTGKGKSAFALNIIANVLDAGKSVLLYSLEMSSEENLKRLLSIVSETNSNKPDKHLMEDDVRRRIDGCGKISQYDLWINDKQQTITTIKATAKAKVNELARQKRTIDLLVIDYVQIMTSEGKVENRQGEVSGIAQNLKSIAKELNIPVLILSQVNAEYQKDKRKLRLNDLRESKAIGHAADVVMFLNKKEDDYQDPFYTLDVLKNRHGPLFFMEMEFIWQYTKFREITEDKEASNVNVFGKEN